jgi:hypothetical protein
MNSVRAFCCHKIAEGAFAESAGQPEALVPGRDGGTARSTFPLLFGAGKRMGQHKEDVDDVLCHYFEIEIIPDPRLGSSGAASEDGSGAPRGERSRTERPLSRRDKAPGPAVTIGLVSRDYPGVLPCGSDANSLGFRGTPGVRSHTEGLIGSPGEGTLLLNNLHQPGLRKAQRMPFTRAYGRAFGAGDTVGLGWVPARNAIFFTKNGTRLPMAFADPEAAPTAIGSASTAASAPPPIRFDRDSIRAMYPAVSLEGPGAAVRTNFFGLRPFRFDLDAYVVRIVFVS